MVISISEERKHPTHHSIGGEQHPPARLCSGHISLVMCPVCKKANIRGQHTHSHAIRKFVVCTLMQAKNRIEAGHILVDYARYTLHRGRGKMVGPSFRGYHIWNVLGCRGTGCGRWHEHPLAHGDRSSSVSNITGSPPSGSCPFFTFFFLCTVFGLGLPASLFFGFLCFGEPGSSHEGIFQC